MSDLPPSLHPATAGFGTAAEDYERGRPDYPGAALDWLTAMLGLRPGTTVVDLAAGTGKLTRLLLGTGARVLAVEPVAAMRARLATLVPGAEACEGTAETMPVPDGAADAVTVAQAFHWFDGTPALLEIRRVLKTRGRLALVWNRRDLEQPLQRRLHELFARYRGDVPTHANDAWRRAFEQTELFGELESRRFPMHQELDAEGLAARVLSVSFMATLPDEERRRVEDELGRIVAEHGDPVVLAYETDCYWCEAR